MPNEVRTLDVSRPVGELVGENPGLKGILDELGFEDLPADRALPEIAEGLGVEFSGVSMALMASGYDVIGYVPEDSGYRSPLPDMLGVLFGGSYEGEGLPDASTAPMFANMEMAIRRAQESGRLPKQ